MATKDKIVNLENLKVSHDDLDGKVSDLKSDLNIVTTLQDWEVGGKAASTGLDFDNQTRLRLTNPVSYKTGYKAVNVADGFEIAVYAYDVNGTYIGVLRSDGALVKNTTNQRWANTFDFSTIPDYNIIIVLRSTTTIESMPVTAGSNVTFQRNRLGPDDTLSIYGMSADAKITGDSIKKIEDSIEENDIFYIDTEKDYNLFNNYADVTEGKRVNPYDGKLDNATAPYGASDYIEVDPTFSTLCVAPYVRIREYNNATDSYDFTYLNIFDHTYFAFYDSEKKFISSTINGTIATIPTTARYLRVTLRDIRYKSIARLVYSSNRPSLREMTYKEVEKKIFQKPNTGFENFTMVMFGDSITHGDTIVDGVGISYVNYVNDYLNSNIINVGFGGTRMGNYGNPLSGAGLFAFYNLCDCIASSNADAWSELDTYATNHPEFQPHLNTLKSINWENVNAIGLFYGANDWTTETPIGTEYNTDISTYDGACAYGLDKLLTLYPHLQVILFSPIYRQMANGDITTDTDNSTQYHVPITDYYKGLKNVSSIVHCPVIDTYHEIQMNKYNIKYYSMDGTHPWTNFAHKRLGHYFAEKIKTLLSPY